MNIHLFFRYLREHRSGAIMFFVFAAMFALSFALYRLPVMAVIYPAALCVIAGIFWLILDFRKTCKKHEQLLEICRNSAAMLAQLPESDRIAEADLRDIIRQLQIGRIELETRMHQHYDDMIDYYTLWVHQIKTPIASMRLILQKEDSPAARQLSSDLFRVEQYVEMALAYLRLDSVSSDYVIRECDMDGIIRQSCRKFAGEFICKKIRLEYEPVSKKVLTDEKWLAFVIEQLLSNSLKYTVHGVIRIDWEEPDVFCIRDTGIGIAPEDLPRVFEKGYTGCNGRTDKRASGIGLYLCRNVCDRLGHRISISSVPGEGTVARIDLSHYNLKAE